ncbi:hypothetical protein GCM10009665_36690 [Kitasatospora nipponensis]|uniref:Secreted protein n=1 Tax=Kitasatospora nipponensis TaxID=258049 RepID=A0ABN1WA71_9ACTN
MRTSMAMAALLCRWWWGRRGAAGACGAGRGDCAADGVPGAGRGAGRTGSGVGTDRRGVPAQVDVQARHEADARGLNAHIDGTHGLIV